MPNLGQVPMRCFHLPIRYAGFYSQHVVGPTKICAQFIPRQDKTFANLEIPPIRSCALGTGTPMYFITETRAAPRTTLVTTVFSNATPNWLKNVDIDRATRLILIIDLPRPQFFGSKGFFSESTFRGCRGRERGQNSAAIMAKACQVDNTVFTVLSSGFTGFLAGES
jgi:hypothetical protein